MKLKNRNSCNFILGGTRESFSFNDAKIRDASHVILFCVKIGIDEAYQQHILEQEEKDGRFAGPSFKKEDMQKGRTRFTDMHRYDLKDAQHWMEKQVYLNIGMVLLGATLRGIDAVPMEGINRQNTALIPPRRRYPRP